MALNRAQGVFFHCCLYRQSSFLSQNAPQSPSAEQGQHRSTSPRAPQGRREPGTSSSDTGISRGKVDIKGK